jgi:hypothetical protein
VKIFYDTEFLEDGRTVELISIGMVAEDGRQLYAVSQEIEEDPLYDRIKRHSWLMSNVVPSLPLSPVRNALRPPHSQFGGSFILDRDDNTVMPRRMIRNAVRQFILETPSPELWAWYGAYDHVALCQLFGRMVDLPHGVPMWTNDLQQEFHRLGSPTGAPVQDVMGKHNALADARHLRDVSEWLATYERSRVHRFSPDDASDRDVDPLDLPK